MCMYVFFMYVSDVPGVGRTKKYTIFLTRKQPANELILCICILGQWSKEGNILCVICMCILYVCMCILCVLYAYVIFIQHLLSLQVFTLQLNSHFSLQVFTLQLISHLPVLINPSMVKNFSSDFDFLAFCFHTNVEFLCHL